MSRLGKRLSEKKFPIPGRLRHVGFFHARRCMGDGSYKYPEGNRLGERRFRKIEMQGVREKKPMGRKLMEPGA